MRSEFAHGGDLRIRDDDRRIREAHGERRATLDSGRTVANHKVEAAAQLVDDALHAFLRQRVLVARLRGRQKAEIGKALVANERLIELRVALGDIDQIKDDASFRAHDEIEIAQADVEIHDSDLVALQRQSGAEGCGRCGLSHAALAGCDNNYLRHVSSSSFSRAERF